MTSSVHFCITYLVDLGVGAIRRIKYRIGTVGLYGGAHRSSLYHQGSARLRLRVRLYTNTPITGDSVPLP